MACFSIILHNFAYIRLKKPSCHDNQYSTLPYQKTANGSRWGAHAVLLWLHAGWGGCISTSRTIRAMCAWCSIKECLIVKVMKYKILKKQ